MRVGFFGLLARAMTVYYAAEVDASLELICTRLREALGLGNFTYSEREPWYVRSELGDYLEEAWHTTESATILASRGRGRKVHPIDWRVHGVPSGANVQIVAHSATPLLDMTKAVNSAFVRDTSPSAELDTIWTINRELTQPIRRIQQAGGGEFVAIFTLAIRPNLDHWGIRFSNSARFEEGEPDEADMWASYIGAGVQAFARDALREGRPIGYLDIEVTELVYHEVDLKTSAFYRTGKTALEDIFERYGIAL